MKRRYMAIYIYKSSKEGHPAQSRLVSFLVWLWILISLSSLLISFLSSLLISLLSSLPISLLSSLLISFLSLIPPDQLFTPPGFAMYYL